MNPMFRIFFISLITIVMLIICPCAPIENDPAIPIKNLHYVQFSAKGFSCQNCAIALQGKLLANPGVISAEVFHVLPANNVRISYNKELTTVDDIKAIILDAGFGISDTKEH